MKRFDGVRALVTGGARGIGLAVAQELAGRGAEIVLTDLDSEALEEARERLAGGGARCSVHALDVTDGEAVVALRDRLHRDEGAVQVVVNNAGVVFGGAFLEVPLERHRLTYRVNVEGVVAVTHAFLPDLIAADAGHLVNMASASGLVALPWGATYASSKWAVIGFSESVRLELERLGHRHVGVTTVCPSYVATGMFEGVRTPLLTTFLTPERLAAKIVRAVRRNRPFVLEPWLVKVTPFLKGVLPTGASDLLSDMFGASTGMKSWRGHPQEDEPPE